ncbi:mobilization protein [Agrobacterium rubi]|nr:mobilization protein [Agrobacterium rubi]NTF30054.1 mobilization protein [Agrobacterium rubi]
MRKPIAQRIKELEERKRSLQSRLDRQERAQATRRKIVLGSFVLERLAQDDNGHTGDHCDLRQWLAAQLPAFLVSDADRALFADLLCALPRSPMRGESGEIGQDETGKGKGGQCQDVLP